MPLPAVSTTWELRVFARHLLPSGLPSRRPSLLLWLACLLVVLAPAVAAAQSAIVVYPDSAKETPRATNTGTYYYTFLVQKTGSGTEPIDFFCDGTNGVTCTSVYPSSAYLGNGQYTEVEVTYTVGAPNTGRLTFRAESQWGWLADTGKLVVPIVVPSYTVAITPDGGNTPARAPNTSGHTATFKVKNTGTMAASYELGCWGGGAVTCTNIWPGTAWYIEPGDSFNAIATHKIETTSGAVTVSATGTYDATGAYDTGNLTVPLNLPGGPRISRAPYHESFRSPAFCAANCFDLIWSHATPAYYSMGAPRSFGLTYSTATARPTPAVMLDITPDPDVTAPTHYQVQVRRKSDNVLLTLLNGTTSAYYAASAQPIRIAALLDARANNLSVTDAAVDVVVTAHFASGSPVSNTLTTRLVFQDFWTSTNFARGFWPAGVPRLYTVGSNRLIVEADGTHTFYAGGAIPAGTSASLTISGTTWVRRVALDGSYVEFAYSTGLPTKQVDRFGNTTTYFWTGTKLDSIADPINRKIKLTYNANGYLATATDPTNRVTTYTVDASGLLTTITDPDNVTTTLSYNSLGLLTSVTGRSGTTTDYAYDLTNRLRSVTAPSIPLHTGGTGRPTTRLFSPELHVWGGRPGPDAAGAKNVVLADSVRGLITVGGKAGDSTLTSGQVTHYDMNNFSAAATVDGNTATNAWNTANAAPGASIKLDFGTPGRALTGLAVYATGTTTASYDVQYSDNFTTWFSVARDFQPGLGWRTARWPYAGVHRYWRLRLNNTPGSGIWYTELAIEVAPTTLAQFAVDRFGAPTRVTDPLGAVTVVVRDTMARPTLVTTASGHQQAFTYSGYLLTQARDLKLNRTVNYTYNAAKDLVTIDGAIVGDAVRRDFTYHNGTKGPAGALDTVKVDGVVTEIHFPDAQGRDTLVTHGNTTHKTRYLYITNTWGNVFTIRPPGGGLHQFHYDNAGRPDSAFTLGRGWSGTAYGLMNQVVTTRDQLGHLTQVQYNPNLTVKRIVDPKGQVYRFSHNALGALTARYDLADTLLAETYQYDEAGNVRTRTTRKGDVITATYDILGRPLQVSGSTIPTETYQYGPLGKWMVAANVHARDSIAFDTLGRVAAETQRLNDSTYEFRYTYNAQGRQTGRTLYINGVEQTTTGKRIRGYTSAGQMASTQEAGVRMLVEQLGVERLPERRTVNYGTTDAWWLGESFDAKHQVVRDTFSKASPNTYFGGRVWRDSLGRPDSVYRWQRLERYAYDAKGQIRLACMPLTNTGGPCLTDYGTFATDSIPYDYDAAGNRVDSAANAVVGPGNRTTQFKGYTLTYDLNGNVLTKTGNGKSWSYSWDGLNRLVAVREAGVLIDSLAYDALGRRVYRNLPGTVDERYVYDGEQVVLDLNAATHAVLREYGWYPGTDRLLSIKNTGNWVGLAIHDAARPGSVQGITDTLGTVLKQYDPTAWGDIGPDNGVVTRFRMAGREFDQSTALYYMRARYYDPRLGRFLSEDPIGVAGGLNLYAYAGNDPVNMSDPSGLGPCPKGYVWVEEAKKCYLDDLEVQGSPDLPPLWPPISTWWPEPTWPDFDYEGYLRYVEWMAAEAAAKAAEQVRKAKRVIDHYGPCASAIAGTVLTGAQDAAFFTGVGASGVLAKLAWNQRSTIAMFAADAVQAMGHKAIAKMRTMEAGLVLGATVSSYYSPDNVQQMLMAGLPGWRDFVPGFATVEAGKKARDTCGAL